MLRAKKKLTKKEMKVDPLLTTYSNVLNFYEHNKKYISYAFTGLVVVVIAIVFYLNNRAANNELASIQLGKIFHFYDQNNYQVAIDGQPEKGLNGLQKIVDEYGGTKSGELARFYLANSFYEIGETDKALAEYEDVSFSDNFLQASVYAGIAACYERKADNSQAAKYYEKAANKVSDNILTPEYLSLAGRNYGNSGKKETAVNIYKRIKKEFKESNVAREADRYIAEYSN